MSVYVDGLVNQLAFSHFFLVTFALSFDCRLQLLSILKAVQGFPRSVHRLKRFFCEFFLVDNVTVKSNKKFSPDALEFFIEAADNV